MSIIPQFYDRNKSILKLSHNISHLIHKPWFLGVMLLSCVCISMLIANLPGIGHHYHRLLEMNVQIHLFSHDGGTDLFFPKDMSVEKFINDILMVFFFFMIGLQIKREFSHGTLSSPKKAVLPVIAAFGGVMVPALIYVAINAGTAASSGWGIPTATDIAFAVCVISIFGKKVPVSLKVFLTALAVTDDLIAILVVIFFYGGKINFLLFGISLVVMALAFILRRVGEKRMTPYLICAMFVWILFYYSGIHATISGVIMAFIIPSAPRYNKYQYYHKSKRLIAKLDELTEHYDDELFDNDGQRYCLNKLQKLSHGSIDMSFRLEKALEPWVNMLIVPLFALANSGVTFNDPSLFNIFSHDPELGSVSMGIFFGLVLGKPLGITLLSWIAVKLKIADMPKGSTWCMLVAVACFGGIGFTMSIFIDTLSFAEQSPAVTTLLRDAGKVSVLLSSICSCILGTIAIMLASKFKTQTVEE